MENLIIDSCSKEVADFLDKIAEASEEELEQLMKQSDSPI